jgi:Retrotransposon gag protein/Zinc knuckle
MSNSGKTRSGGRPNPAPTRDNEETEAPLRDDDNTSSSSGSEAADPTAASPAVRSDEEDEDAEQALVALRAQSAKLQEQAARLQAQLEAAEERATRESAERRKLKAQLARHGAGGASHAPAAAPIAMDAPRVKLPEMATYAGRADENLDAWLRDASAMVEFQGLGAELQAVKWMALYLKGDAQEWWQGGVKSGVTTVAELDQALHQRFQPPQSAQVARTLVAATKQGGDGVAAYASRFQSAAAKVPGGMTAAEQVFAFTNGLRHALAVEVVKQGCATLQDAIQGAIMQESLARTQAGAGTGGRPKGGASLNASLSALDTGAPDPETGGADEPVWLPVLLSAIHAMGAGRGGRGAGSSGAGGKRPRLSPGEQRRRRDNGLCFNCGQKGHSVRACTSPFAAAPPGAPGGVGSSDSAARAEGQGKD